MNGKQKPIELYQAIATLVDYDPSTGHFTRRRTGKKAGCRNPYGYIQIGGKGTTVLAHRLAWVIMHGELPIEIDHINRVRDDNRLENLRNVTHAENLNNQPSRRKRYKTNRSNHGVTYNRHTDRWMVVVAFHAEADAIAAREAMQGVLDAQAINEPANLHKS